MLINFTIFLKLDVTGPSVYISVETALSVAALQNKIGLPSTPVKASQNAELSEKKKKGNFPATPTPQFKVILDIL